MATRPAELDGAPARRDLATRCADLRAYGVALRRGFADDAARCAAVRHRAADACRQASLLRAAVPATWSRRGSVR